MSLNIQPMFSKSASVNLIKKFNRVKNYAETERNNFGRKCHFIGGISALCFSIFDILCNMPIIALFTLLGSYLNFGLDKMFHNIAMRKSQSLVRWLKSNGVNDKNYLNYMVDLYLKKHGGILYSNFVRKFQKHKINDIVEGQKASQFRGIMTYIRDKYGLFTPEHINKAQAIKRKRNIKKLLY